MAIDNLNYYSSGLPAGQQTDKYSSQPGCLKSKNLDIFSSSKSVKATAWSEAVNTAQSGVVLVDQTGDLVLKSDGGVYDRSSGTETLVKSGIAANFPSYDVSYNGPLGTFAPAQWGTEKQLISKYENGTLKYFTIFTDKARYIYSKEQYNVTDDDEVRSSTAWTKGAAGWTKNGSGANTVIRLKVNNTQGLTKAKLAICASNPQYAAQGHLTIASIKVEDPRYWYNAETENMDYYYSTHTSDVTITDQLDDSTDKYVYIDIPLFPISDGYSYCIEIKFTVTPGTDNTTTWSSGELLLDVGRYNDAYNYLPVRADRELVDIGEYYWEKGDTFQTLYAWNGEWITDNAGNRERVVRYSLEKYMGWANDVSMDVVGIIAWNEQIYMIGNMNGNGYITPCDLSGGRGTPYIAYGCTFKGATNIDYLLYLVGEDRGISTLWVFNQQELVPLVGGNKESDIVDLVDPDEQYKFDGKIVNYRKNLILTTEDGRIFQYGQTYGGKGGAFVHDLKPEDHDSLTIDSMRADGNDLIIKYTVVDTIEGTPTTTHWAITYQDDIAAKNYNTEWSATYPIVLGNHLLEKEESDLYASYILPSHHTKLEFWGMANHYHFWTFKSTDNPELNTSTHYKLKDIDGSYYLEYVEKNGQWWTFRLVGDLPSLTGIGGLGLGGGGIGSFIIGVAGEGTYQIVDGNGNICLTYNVYNHFRKIGEITTEEYQEGEFRFHNLNNKLELPKTHSLQIMVKGIGTKNYTPELFALDLVANQRDRG